MLTENVVESTAISHIKVSMETPSITVTFTKSVDGEPVKNVQFLIAGELFGTVFGAEATPGMSRGADMSAAIYQAALEAGVISGSFS